MDNDATVKSKRCEAFEAWTSAWMHPADSRSPQRELKTSRNDSHVLQRGLKDESEEKVASRTVTGERDGQRLDEKHCGRL